MPSKPKKNLKLLNLFAPKKMYFEARQLVYFKNSKSPNV